MPKAIPCPHGFAAMRRCHECAKDRWKRHNTSAAGVARRKRYQRSERGRATNAAFQKTPKGLAIRLRHANKARQAPKHMPRIAAREVLKNAVRSGKMERPTACACCGGGGTCRRDRVEAHHFLGYAPAHHLDVVWLCVQCHKAAHVMCGHDTIETLEVWQRKRVLGAFLVNARMVTA